MEKPMGERQSFTVEGPEGPYEVFFDPTRGEHKGVGFTPQYDLYQCVQIPTGRQCLLQIASHRRFSGNLDRAAYYLRQLRAEALRVEEEYARVKTDPKEMLNYQLGFPELVASFVSEQQGRRRINILAFDCADEMHELSPLRNIPFVDRERIDTKTSAWILGKTLKILAFVHESNIGIGTLDITKVIVHPNGHIPILFDWSSATSYTGGVSRDAQRSEIMGLARATIIALGGDPMSRTIPLEGNEEDFEPYVEILRQLAGGRFQSASAAHEAFYGVVTSIWTPGRFHPWTTFPLTNAA